MNLNYLDEFELMQLKEEVETEQERRNIIKEILFTINDNLEQLQSLLSGTEKTEIVVTESNGEQISVSQFPKELDINIAVKRCE